MYMVMRGNKVIFIFLLLWSVVSCTPILSRPSYYVALFSFAIAVLILCQSSIKRQRPLLFGITLYIIIAMSYKLVGFSSAEWGNYMNQLSFFIPILLMVLIPEKLSLKQTRFLWWLMIVVMAFNIADNIRLSILYPEINAVSRLYLDEDFLSSINAGGTSFYTFSLLFFNICFLVYLNCKEKKIKYLSFAICVLSSIYILVFCLKASVVVYYILSLALQFFAYKTKKPTLFIFVLVFSGLFAFSIIALFQDAIVDFIVSVSPNERLTARLVTLIDAENAEANMNTITGRANLYLLSIDTWLSSFPNFIFGIGDHRAAQGAFATGIGQHADLLDSLARYGILGLVSLFLIFKYSFRFILSIFDKKYKLQLATIFFILILCGFTKGIFSSGVGCVVFLFLPLCRVLLCDNDRERIMSR